MTKATIWRNRSLGLLFALGVYLLDQVIKGWVYYDLKLESVGQIKGVPFFDLTFMANRGISLGLFTAGSPEERWWLVVVTGLIALFVLVWLLRERKLGDIAALALVLGGAAGNIRDRYEHGFVIDYADLHFGSFRPFLIFNLADAAITIGVVIILARSLLSREKPVVATDPVPEI
ncbi:signal peptidase II [Novosphingobium sp. Rr 2-17]|uniref:signal peptidase II n=1 Tax=Novosphingobium sp. Rr 2-17 TaxID=555793 RepID=UPI000269ABBB|nr:signal peptidase II [Novosphingobium sp. Rr 2-17]EIZ77628.1 signal peptidase II [Novosphingobium sp. Rr 2-17]